MGKKTGKNPTDRGKLGVKRSVLIDGRGVPLGAAVDGANVHDQKLVKATLDNIPVERPKPAQRKPQHLCLDKGYTGEPVDREVRRRHYIPHLQFDEQWTYVARKQARLTVDEKAERHDVGDMYIWTCIDQKTKLMPSFLIGKRSADNARRFMMDVAGRLVFPSPYASDAHSFQPGGYKAVVQISTDGFAAYPEAIDLAFGPYVKYGQCIKNFRNANMIYTPSEMTGVDRKGIKGIGDRERRTISTSHVERLNGTQRVFLKRLNRLTLCFSKKLENLEAAFAMFAAYYNFCWQTRKPGNSGKLRSTAAMMNGLGGHVWSFDELFETVLK